MAGPLSGETAQWLDRLVAGLLSGVVPFNSDMVAIKDRLSLTS